MINILLTHKIKPWRQMYACYESVLYKSIIINPLNTIYGYINSLHFNSIDDKITLTKFINYHKLGNYPITYIFRNKMLDKSLAKSSSIYFVKNVSSNLCGGNGVNIFDKANDVMNFLRLNKYDDFVIQENIGNPYLIENRKCDFRFYVLAVNINGNISFYMYNNGFAKLAAKKYDKYGNLENSIFLTNNAQLKDAIIYDNRLVSSLDKEKEIFNKSFDLLQIYMKPIKAYTERDLKNKNIFQVHVIGPDIIFDDKLNPYILEFNIPRPAYIHRKDNIETKTLKINVGKDIMTNFVYSYKNTKKISLENSKFILLT
jgi:hypothetical protein